MAHEHDSAAVQECPHGETIPEVCPPCQRDARAVARAVIDTPREWSRPFPARYAGTCDECGFDIAVGQMIRLCDDVERDRREYRHEGCVEDA
jgi:hypothetical protein